VDWYPWSKDAFSEAENSDRPILLSVGYSACHWCHVMAHESFEDLPTAEVMNKYFVNIKVDREERPDIDAIYMEAVMALTGRGGWPMTVFLDTKGKPFHAGTYWPNQPRGGMPSFSQVLEAVHTAWSEQRPALLELGTQLTQRIALQAQLSPTAGLPKADTFDFAIEALLEQHDTEWGGFSGAPKFPQAMNIEALIRSYSRKPEPRNLSAITTTLDAMASGGIADHLGGGFARYSVDEQWRVPHFEKMLYDNALLAQVYLHAWQVFGFERWRCIAEETIEYVLRDLRLPQGGFASAQDADSEGSEGRFYLWEEDEIRAICGSDAQQVIDWYGIIPSGNFEGLNILYRPVRGDLLRPPRIEHARSILLQARNKRIAPALDNKVLTEWNALMLAALTQAAVALSRPDWLTVAIENAEFLLENLRNEDGRWMRSWDQEGGTRHLGYAADLAAIVDAFTRLSEATGEVRWIKEATSTAEQLLDGFSDEINGGFFTTGLDAEALITRPKDILDNAHPSANSLAAFALLRLGSLTGESRFLIAADSVLRLLGNLVLKHPTAFGHLLGALDLNQQGITEIVVTGTRPDLVHAAARKYRPNAILSWGERPPGPLWEGREGDLAWVCRNFTCSEPATTTQELLDQLSDEKDHSL